MEQWNSTFVTSFVPSQSLLLVLLHSNPRVSARKPGAIVGEGNMSMSMAVREQHGRDESYHAEVDGIFPPQVVRYTHMPTLPNEFFPCSKEAGARRLVDDM
jgi:hypothetical protein